MKNPEYISPAQPEEIISALVHRLNERTEPMSTVIQMVELPEFQEVLKLGEGAFPYILDDRENFSHWHLNMTIQIAESIGEPIEFPEDIALNVQAYFERATAWLEHRLQPPIEY